MSAEIEDGNVHIVTNDLRGDPLFFSKLIGKHGGFQLFQQGEPSRVALIITYETEGDGLSAPISNGYNLGDTDPANTLEVGPLIADSAADEFGVSQPRVRCNFEWRWWPGDWACLNFMVAETEQINGGAWAIQSGAEYRVQRQPGYRSVGDASDPLTWERLPGSNEASTAYPAVQTVPFARIRRVMRLLYPLAPADADVAPYENGDFGAYPRNRMPGSFPEYMRYLLWTERRTVLPYGPLTITLNG